MSIPIKNLFPNHKLDVMILLIIFFPIENPFPNHKPDVMILLSFSQSKILFPIEHPFPNRKSWSQHSQFPMTLFALGVDKLQIPRAQE